jgi:hypothetical protein
LEDVTGSGSAAAVAVMRTVGDWSFSSMRLITSRAWSRIFPISAPVLLVVVVRNL